jgi:hypothetical protein
MSQQMLESVRNEQVSGLKKQFFFSWGKSATSSLGGGTFFDSILKSVDSAARLHSRLV